MYGKRSFVICAINFMYGSIFSNILVKCYYTSFFLKTQTMSLNRVPEGRALKRSQKPSILTSMSSFTSKIRGL